MSDAKTAIEAIKKSLDPTPKSIPQMYQKERGHLHRGRLGGAGGHGRHEAQSRARDVVAKGAHGSAGERRPSSTSRSGPSRRLPRR